MLFATVLLTGCAKTISCANIEDPPFGDRLTLAKELPADGPVSQKWIEQHAAIIEACGYE